MLLVLTVSMLIPLLIALYTRENSSGKAFATVLAGFCLFRWASYQTV